MFRMNKQIGHISKEAVKAFWQYNWTGSLLNNECTKLWAPRRILQRTRRQKELNTAGEEAPGGLSTYVLTKWGREQTSKEDQRQIVVLPWFDVMLTCLYLEVFRCHSGFLRGSERVKVALITTPYFLS